ncbi:hypothetical protein EMCRGX_G000361 [Ephydatia muelleri]
MSRSSRRLFVGLDEVNCNNTSPSRMIQPILEPNTPAVQPKASCRRRAIESKGAILVLIICTCVDVGKLNALNQLTQTLFQSQPPFTLLSTFICIAVGVAIPQLFYPLAGWLADARYGRHRVIQISLWCMWAGECVLSVTLLLFELCRSYSTTYHDMFIYFLFPVAFVIINVGVAGFQANIIQFGIDQMVDASGDQMSAFIHWYYWSTYIGGALFSVVLKNFLRAYTLYALEVGVDTLLVSVSLLCWYKLKSWLIIEPQCQNPFKTVYEVIKFASKHKHPIYRSALTYWDDTRPSRIDLGKSKYGGPFSTEEVESVKSFVAIAGVLLSLGLYITAEYTMVLPLLNRMTDTTLPHSVITAGNFTVFALQVLPILVVIPVCELVIYPLVQNCIPTILKKIGIGMIVIIIWNIVSLILYVTLHSMQVTHEDHHCFEFNSTADRNETLPAPIIAVPFAICSFSELLVYIAGFEFICAQSPYSFRGMLIGTFYAIQGLSTTIAVLIAFIFAYGYNRLDGNYGCGYIYYPVTLGIAIVGFVVYMVVGWRYKGRERDEHIDHHIIAENYFSKDSVSI